MNEKSKKFCSLCPRRCSADRSDAAGACRSPYLPSIAKVMLHRWEEPCVSGDGDGGAGAVFFSGCPLGCRFCQNAAISRSSQNRDVIDADGLRRIYDRLIKDGAYNIDLVTPTHYAETIAESLKEPLPVPVIWNSSAYELPSMLDMLDGKINVYLPDMKYSSSDLASRYSRAADYPDIAREAILHMYRQVGDYETDENGMIRRGVIIRHLILPGELENTRGVINWVAKSFKPGQVLFSLMAQYTPVNADNIYPNLNRKITQEEYDICQQMLFDSGIEDGYIQEPSSSDEKYIPDF